MRQSYATTSAVLVLLATMSSSLSLLSTTSKSTRSPLDLSATSRRSAIQNGCTTSTIAALVATGGGPFSLIPSPSFAVPSPSTKIRVKTWPGLEYLEPIYELQLSLEALNRGASDASKFPILTQRLDKFFRGGPLSERNYYIGLGLKYSDQIQYDENELRDFIKMDKEERFRLMEGTLDSVKDLYSTLQQESPNATEIQRFADQARASLARWFALVPSSDVESVRKLFVASREADTNRNGQLEDDELANMQEEYREVWKRRIDLFGRQ